MALTPAQNSALKADISADPVLSAIPNTADGAYEIAAAYNLLAAVDFMVWRTDAPTLSIFDAITWANYTPNDPPDATVIFTNRTLLAQTKQMNLQNMLTSRSQIDASKSNIRAGLRDAVIALPTGTNGAMTSAGGTSGATVLAACMRKALRIEKLFAGANATTGPATAALLVYEGQIQYSDIQAARN